MNPGSGRWLTWAAVAIAVAAISFALERAGVASPTILVALVIGIVVAIHRPGRIAVTRPTATVAQAVVGTMLGLVVGAGSFSALDGAWVALVLGAIATLVFGMLLSAILQRSGRMDAATATLAMIPGGAIGIVTMARDLDGDDRLVAFSQYLRVLVILAATPVVAATLLPRAGPAGAAPAAAAVELLPMVGAAAFGFAGWAAARALKVAGGSLLGPLIVCAAVGLLLPGLDLQLPGVLREVAFALIGLDVGLRFTRESLAYARWLLPALMWTLAGLLAACLALAVVMSATTSMGLLDAYLATTPGGLAVVAATAYGTGANLTVVVAAQALRMLFTMLLTPVAVRVMVRVLQPRPVGP